MHLGCQCEWLSGINTDEKNEKKKISYKRSNSNIKRSTGFYLMNTIYCNYLHTATYANHRSLTSTFKNYIEEYSQSIRCFSSLKLIISSTKRKNLTNLRHLKAMAVFPNHTINRYLKCYEEKLELKECSGQYSLLK